jgi:predicted nucleic acid-binding protein
MVRQMRHWLDAGRGAITEIIKLELLPACRTEQEYLKLDATLDALHPLPLDVTIWSAASRNGFSLRQSGVVVPAMDLLIATVAQQFGTELAHMDRHCELMAPHLALRTISLL